MELPIPTHLQKYLVPIGENNQEHKVTGVIQCTCHSEEFQVYVCVAGIIR